MAGSVGGSLSLDAVFESVDLAHLVTQLSGHLGLDNELLLLEQILLVSGLLSLKLAEFLQLLCRVSLESLVVSLDLALSLSMNGILEFHVVDGLSHMTDLNIVIRLSLVIHLLHRDV